MFTEKSGESFAIIGGFLGMGTHDVAVPISHLKYETDKLILPGATKDTLKAMPEFRYAKSQTRDTKTSPSVGLPDFDITISGFQMLRG